ncbi:hypothetical protein ABW19_dt0203029 [Dactylella cylindrospora]|nr:hypothetical protein ABW19_dt0203029 [Dactylella cylindrospora]
MFVQAIQVFQRLALLPIPAHHSPLPRIWQFRRLFYKLYRAGVPIHQSDILNFLSSIGFVDPLIYNMIIYTAAGVNDASAVAKLSREYEHRTGNEMPLDAVTSVFHMFRRLEDTEGLRRVYEDADKRGLQPRRNNFFMTAVILVEAQKPSVDYWQLCQLYNQFFDQTPLVSLGLPLNRETKPAPNPDDLLEPTIGTLAIMLHSYFKTALGRFDGSKKAFGVYETYLRLLRDGALPQFQNGCEHFLAIIVRAVGRDRSSLGLALGIVQDMIDLDVLPTPTALTWGHLLQVSTEYGDVSISERVWEAMVGHGISPTSYAYNSMMILYASAGDEGKASALQARMIEEGWSMTLNMQHAYELALKKGKTRANLFSVDI